MLNLQKCMDASERIKEGIGYLEKRRIRGFPTIKPRNGNSKKVERWCHRLAKTGESDLIATFSHIHTDVPSISE